MTLPRLAQIVLTLVTLGLALILIGREYSWPELESQLQRLDPFSIVALLALTLATRAPQAEALRLALQAFGKRVTFMDSFWLIAIKAFFNQVFSGIGLLAQALRLKVAHAISLSVFSAATWTQMLAQLFAVAAAGLVIGILFAVTRTASPLMVVTPWLVLLVIAGILLILPRGMSSLPLLGARFETVSRFFSANQVTHAQWLHLTALFVTILLTRAARLGLIVALIAPETSVLVFLFAFMVGELALIAPVTPGGIGVRELLLGIGAIGGGAESIMLAGIVDRAAAILVTLGLGGAALLRSTRSNPVSS